MEAKWPPRQRNKCQIWGRIFLIALLFVIAHNLTSNIDELAIYFCACIFMQRWRVLIQTKSKTKIISVKWFFTFFFIFVLLLLLLLTRDHLFSLFVEHNTHLFLYLFVMNLSGNGNRNHFSFHRSSSFPLYLSRRHVQHSAIVQPEQRGKKFSNLMSGSKAKERVRMGTRKKK